MLMDAWLDMTCSYGLINVKWKTFAEKGKNLPLKIVDIVQQIIDMLPKFSFKLITAADDLGGRCLLHVVDGGCVLNFKPRSIR